MLGPYITRRRKSMNLSINALAKQAGLSHTYVSDIERGEVKQPSIRVIAALATALGTTIEELLTAAGLHSITNLGLASHTEAEQQRTHSEGTGAEVVTSEALGQDPRLFGVSAAWVDLQEGDREIIYNAAIILRELRVHLRTVEQVKSIMPSATGVDKDVEESQ